MSKEELLKIERGFWHEGSDYYEKYVADEAIFVFAGMVLGKEDGVSSADQVPPWDHLKLDSEVLLELSDDVALLTYHAEGQREGEGSYSGNITTIYRLTEDGPQMIFHQHTPDSGGVRN